MEEGTLISKVPAFSLQRHAYTTVIGKNSIAFPDTNNTANEDGRIEVAIYLKPTHMGKCVDFHPQSPPTWPVQSKRDVLKTLMDRATEMHSIDNYTKTERRAACYQRP